MIFLKEPMMKSELLKIREPELLFGHQQMLEDPRDGLTLFGPLDEGSPHGIRWGIVGTQEGMRRFKGWLDKIQGPISNTPPAEARPPFPGFEAAFKIPWRTKPEIELVIPNKEIEESVYIDEKHQRVNSHVYWPPLLLYLRSQGLLQLYPGRLHQRVWKHMSFQC